MSTPDVQPDDDRVSLHPLSFQEAMEGLLRSERPNNPAATLDALTFDDELRETMDNGGHFITHDELIRKLGRT
jgi:hypothetical protein